jgi:hypothetical protein
MPPYGAKNRWWAEPYITRTANSSSPRAKSSFDPQLGSDRFRAVTSWWVCDDACGHDGGYRPVHGLAQATLSLHLSNHGILTGSRWARGLV